MKLVLREDGTVVYLDSPYGPYHVARKDVDQFNKYDLDELLQYAQDHPEVIIPEFESKSPEQIETEAEIAKNQEYLDSTDWYDIRSIKGKDTPPEITERRASARERISILRGEQL